jgi:lipoic acid synthetase
VADIKLHKGEAKTSRIPIKVVPQPRLKMPGWIRAKSPNSPEVLRL